MESFLWRNYDGFIDIFFCLKYMNRRHQGIKIFISKPKTIKQMNVCSIAPSIFYYYLYHGC